MKGIIAGLTLMALSGLAGAEDYDGIPERFMEHFAARQFDQAIDALKLSNKQVDNDERTQLIDVITKLMASDYKFHELVFKEPIGTHYVTLRYIVGIGEKPAGLQMQLYKTDTQWITRTFSFNSSYDDLIKNLKKDK